MKWYSEVSKRKAVFRAINVWKMPLRMLLRLVLELTLKNYENSKQRMEQLTVNRLYTERDIVANEFFIAVYVHKAEASNPNIRT